MVASDRARQGRILKNGGGGLTPTPPSMDAPL